MYVATTVTTCTNLPLIPYSSCDTAADMATIGTGRPIVSKGLYLATHSYKYTFTR